MSLPSPVDELLRAACEGERSAVREILARHPDLPEQSFPVACVTGNVRVVEAALAGDPALACQPVGAPAVEPLVATCLSPLLREDPSQAAGIVAVARLLLGHGADPNAGWTSGPPGHSWRLTPLYGAAGRANHAELTRLLLEAGAAPDDQESLYHSAEFADLTCTRLLLEHGATVTGTNAVHRKLDYDDLPGLQLFLDHGVSPDLTNHQGDTLLHTAISNDRRLAFIELLADRGANLRIPNHLRLTPYRLAARLGRDDVATFLTGRGAADELDPHERFVAACSRGDTAAARAELQANPGLRDTLGAADRSLLTHHAWCGRLAAVRTMLEVGFAPATIGLRGETALHNAAWMGHLGVVELLLGAGAPLEIVEPRFQATPLRWALHGREFSRDPEGRPLAPEARYDAVILRLLAAGARVTPEVLKGLSASLPEPLRDALQAAAQS